MKEIVLKSGAKLEIGETEWAEAFKLFQTVVKSMRSVEADETVKSLNDFVAALIGAQISDEEVVKSMWTCFGRCTYNKTRITPELFKDMKAREDFIDICLEVGQENLGPFLKALSASLPRLTKMILDSRKPK